MISRSLAQTSEQAKKFLEKIKDQKTAAMVVGLFGDLGSGKTTFTQALGKHLGIKDFITSPTFVLEKIYQLDGRYNFKRFIHIDAYRLASGQELISLGFMEILKDKNNLILIEWPERVLDILPDDLIKINFKFLNETDREIVFS